MKITVEKLIELLKIENPKLEMYFGGLEFYRLHEVGNSCHMEFNQTVYEKDGKVVVENH